MTVSQKVHSLTQLATRDVSVLVVQWFGIRLMIERSLVRLPVGALSSQLGQLSLPSLWGR